ncbi:DUF3710 domain-containing protein [Bifidobacterium vansinderenii]|uniref:DUF3710 domain-containing protein n=1 Tax=Bifidobacterium vansinderenii TaxID=1984871 RepID=A0A229VV48_9BIFI|nr:DUF3710 domain-containing protein [Bifidobacterium vansinderenii]OXM99502.1 hypothetical protein Tam10B_2249 [Bifidobacterium vansinderenii]
MGLFGFGRKKHAEEEAKENETDKAVDAAEDVEATSDDSDENEDETAAKRDDRQPTADGERGENQGPWDVDDENIPDYDDYLDIGSLYLPFLQGIELRLKGNRQTNQILGATITWGDSSLELEAFAAPKSFGLWDDVRSDLMDANRGAEEQEGTFGTELILPVKVGKKILKTRIVGVDGPRWMLRGVFSGPAATDEGSEEKKTLDKYFSDVVVERGEEPLAPRDLIPMHPPIGPAERAKQAAAEGKIEDDEDSGESKAAEIPGKPKGPLSKTLETETQTTLRRGPLFSEVR